MTNAEKRRIPALRVHQWRTGWNKIDFDPIARRAKPPQHFYLFTLPARELRSLSGIFRRDATIASRRINDLGIQRQHNSERSDEIGRFVEFGYPWSTLSEVQTKQRRVPRPSQTRLATNCNSPEHSYIR